MARAVLGVGLAVERRGGTGVRELIDDLLVRQNRAAGAVENSLCIGDMVECVRGLAEERTAEGAPEIDAAHAGYVLGDGCRFETAARVGFFACLEVGTEVRGWQQRRLELASGDLDGA